MPGQIEVDPPPQQVSNSRISTGRSAARRQDGHHTRCSKSQMEDGMVLLQKMANKSTTIVTVKDLVNASTRG